MNVTVAEFIQWCDECQENEGIHHRVRWLEAPEELWFEVLREYPEYIDFVIFNKRLPHSVLVWFATFPNETIRGRLLMKGQITSDILEILSNDPESSIREGVCPNPQTPLSVLEKLTRDIDENVANVAKKWLQLRRDN